MAFNSYPFLLLFLPLVVCAYWLAARWQSAAPRLLVVVLATLGFYALAAAWALPVLLASIAGNFACSRLIAAREGAARQFWLVLGVSANVLALVAIKYSGFLAQNLAGLTGGAAAFAGFALPLGISFYTFQQIALLVDTARGQITRANPLTYLASVLFFPTIVSGPITFYREFAPQIEAAPDAARRGTDIFVGAALLIIGLFKKLVIGDSFGLWVDPLFAGLGHGAQLDPLMAWALVLGFLLQMYFDFSGYSDMALGAARLFGIRLPLNFHSPMRVTSIIDWWRRWHMSLGRFVSEYIFQPLALRFTRAAMARGASRDMTMAAGVLVPTFVAMLTIGAWHGGNWTYVVFGLLHAAYMMIAETWRHLRRRQRKKQPAPWWQAALGNVLTIVAVLVALVPFRAPDMAVALTLWRDMAGLDGVAAAPLVWPVLPGLGASGFAGAIIGGLLFVYLLPNSTQLLARFEPALASASWVKVSPPVLAFALRPSLRWGVAGGVLLVLGLAFISRGTASFVYFGF